MSVDLETAEAFFEACEIGKGWEGCEIFCQPNATFSSQASVLSDLSTLEQYCDWMKGFFTPVPDGHCDLKFFAEDEARNSVTAVAVFHGTQTGPGGPVPPTGKQFAADYVYHMVFTDGRISHLTKIWNDTDSLAQIGWS